MEVLDIIAAKRNLARRVLRDLIDNYKKLDDNQRLEKSNTIMDELDSYLQIVGNLFLPFMKKSGEFDDLVAKIDVIHVKLDNMAEQAIMMQVDEPSGEYFKAMVRLSDILDEGARVDEQVLFPWARTYLSEEDQYFIAKNLKTQMVQESLPASGLTIY